MDGLEIIRSFVNYWLHEGKFWVQIVSPTRNFHDENRFSSSNRGSDKLVRAEQADDPTSYDRSWCAYAC
jgi:hypothetical protein